MNQWSRPTSTQIRPILQFSANQSILSKSQRYPILRRKVASADIHDGPDHNTLQSETGYINASALAILAAARLFRIDASASDRFWGN
jgi:hypothetical protein